MKKIILLMSCLLFILCGCGNEKEHETNPIVTMKIAEYGEIKIELYPKVAPNTVANFVTLIESGFYDNNTIHRVAPGFVIQGGDPDGNGTGGPGYAIKGEFSQNGFTNNLSHERGVISMARSSLPDSAGSQFFIVVDDSAKYSLDGAYAGFGKVTDGMDIVDKIVSDAKIADKKSGLLEKNLVIEKVTVDTFGESYKVKKITK